MLLKLGDDFFDARKGTKSPVVVDTSKVMNPHLLILGSSGAGKSFTFRRLINQGLASSARVRFHVYDVHGDLEVPGASSVTFSEVAPFGLNPLRVNPNPEFGGVRKCIQAFVRILNQSFSTPLGITQETVLRNLLEDVLRDFGFEMGDPKTWAVNEFDSQLISAGHDNKLYLQVPMAEKEEAKGYGARWDVTQKLWWIPVHKYTGGATKWPPAYKPRAYPTIMDVRNYAQRLYEERFMGTDQKAVAALHTLNKVAKAHHRRVLEKLRLQQRDVYDEAAEDALEVARLKFIEACTDYANAIRTGHEMENLLKYESADTLKSVINRLNSIIQAGIFKTQEPDFDPQAQVWRYNLRPLEQEQKKMMVLFLLQELFNNAVERGESAEVLDVIVLDELSLYTSSQDDKGDGIIGVIARQARKFGLGLWAADQSPANIPEGLSSSVATRIILGLDETLWPAATTKLRVETKLLEWIQPKSTMAAQIKESGSTKTRWRWVQIS